MKPIIRIAAILAIVGITVVVYVKHSIKPAVEAELNLQAMYTVVSALEKYMDTQPEGEVSWPTSWTDMIDKVKEVQPDNVFKWPKDYIELSQRIGVQFDIDPRHVDDPAYKYSRLIKIRGPVFEGHQGRLIELEDAINQRKRKRR